MKLSHWLIVVGLLAMFTRSTRAEDAYFRVRVERLKLLEGKLPTTRQDESYREWRQQSAMWPRVVLEGSGEAYVEPDNTNGGWNWRPPIEEMAVNVAAPVGADVEGRLFFPKPKGEGMDVVAFTIPASAATKDVREQFFLAKANHYDRLAGGQIAGAAWFRHQANEALKAAGKNPRDENRQRGTGNADSLDDTYAMFSGGRAVSENLQLDRVLPAATQESGPPVKLDSIKGLEVKEIDWKPLTVNAKPDLDPLAAAIPADQHAMFFPSLKTAAAVLELAEKHSTPVIQSMEPQSESSMVRQRYEKQLCHTLAEILALGDGGLVQSVAVTGSDPYVRVGTDVAVVFESAQPEALRQRIAAKIEAGKDAKPASGDADGLKYSGAASDDRTISAYVAATDKVVILTNSLAQLRRLSATRAGSAPSLASAPEYTFFRNRYVRGQDDESAFLVLTDATIRRWCSPRWRIADSRRTRMAAVMSELSAQNIDALAKRQAPGTPLTTAIPLVNAGELRLTNAGVTSSTYGSLAFMTPIVELNVAEVTKSEASAYERWRDTYQRNWSWAFDPIALRIGVLPTQVKADVTVMPIIDFSQYAELMAASKGATIKPGSGDPHDALAHVVYSINPDSEPMKQLGMTLSAFAPAIKVSPFDWLGQTVALYADDDPFWKDLAAAKDPEDFFGKNFPRLPIAVHAEVRNGLKLAAFLTAFRGFVEQAAPGLTAWQTPQWHERAYVKISSTEQTRQTIGEDFPNFAIHYYASAHSFVLTLNEDLLKRAIDRDIARSGATTQPAAAAPPPATLPATRPWLGQNLALQVNRRVIDVVRGSAREYYQDAMQTLSWGNIPILNEWKSRFPDRDPIELHEQLWHVRLIDPAGGKYVWNEQLRTMQSSVYGSPEEPKPGPDSPGILQQFVEGNFGVDFEDKGIRAKANVTLQPSSSSPSSSSR